jgi:hypothetical protein
MPNGLGCQTLGTNSGARPVLRDEDLNYNGNPTNDLIDIKIFSLSELLKKQEVWDLVHMDVQGAEGELCSSAMALLSERVRYIVIGTHSRKIEGDLLLLFFRAGWVLEHEKPMQFSYNINVKLLENMNSGDGTQVWRNPSL